MIVKMKKCTVIALMTEKESALKALRNVGVLHVEVEEMADSADRADLEKKLIEANNAFHLLSAIKTEEEPGPASRIQGDELCQKVLDLDKQKNILAKDLENLEKNRILLEPWGDFSPELIASLKEKGVHVYLCSGNSNDMANIPVEAEVKLIKETKYRTYFAVISQEEIEEGVLPLANVPLKLSLNQLNDKIEKINNEINELDETFEKLLADISVLEEYVRNIEEKLEFVSNRDGMLDAGAVACLNGYCPVPNIEQLKQAAKKHGWGLLFREPSKDDNPPTLISIPKIFEASKAIFDFIGISPGYREWDTSACFLFFFTLFFSMIVGDAGYGALFLVSALFAKKKLGGKKQKTDFYINLFILLSCATVFWGFLTGNYFAIPSKYLPSWMQGFEWFTDPETKDKHIQLVCFIIAVVHLSFARFWKASLVINSTKALPEIGWGLILWGNFFVAKKLIVFPASQWPLTTILIFYGIGLFLVAVFGINWKKIDEVFQFFFGMSGTFVDLLSYIRLFAVGLSSYYIAKSFNDMGMMVFNISSHTAAIPFLIIGMVVVILFGHILNLMLAILGVLVHGIRLNTLEFSNHMGLQWLGHAYKPFRKQE